MEIVTRVRDFSEKMQYHSISSDTYIRVIIDDLWQNAKGALPQISHKRQKEMLNCMPTEYEPSASKELIEIISNSRINTKTPEF